MLNDQLRAAPACGRACPPCRADHRGRADVRGSNRAGRLAAGAAAGIAACLAVACATAAEGPRSRLCPQDAPEGVRLPPRAGCDTVTDRQRAEAGGFRDLGNGVTLRVGGRSRLDLYTGR